jgi:hypothetical protein
MTLCTLQALMLVKRVSRGHEFFAEFLSEVMQKLPSFSPDVSHTLASPFPLTAERCVVFGKCDDTMLMFWRQGYPEPLTAHDCPAALCMLSSHLTNPYQQILC